MLFVRGKYIKGIMIEFNIVFMCFHLMIYTHIEFAYYVRRAQTIQFLNSGGLNFWEYTPLNRPIHGYCSAKCFALE